ncbi:hypothetical protein H310_05777 [Aphanomyces invadans]|uniref:TNFR-Cys domain-containing protein n=1 Tax=Aphanomyces invadans TaxID=157072 RepID=A0A024U8J1_9STRA|nr:hypothetical protein H310_05777 [Aphanomyces invadans]ETW02212.1 hypothetical protein H310_05777 [Aphanomyces invadans]|eukprot:XP_008868817.1 hypothetical protein H310_05777 [Aphanomyces invadans]
MRGWFGLFATVLSTCVVTSSYGTKGDMPTMFLRNQARLGATVFESNTGRFALGEKAQSEFFYLIKKPCFGMMPNARCPKLCEASDIDDTVQDCTRCIGYKLMPKSSCTQCKKQSCHTCGGYKLMPTAKCTGYEIRPTTTVKPTTTTKPTTYPTPAPTTYPTTKPTPSPTTYQNPVVAETAGPAPAATIPIPDNGGVPGSNGGSSGLNSGTSGTNGGSANGGAGSASTAAPASGSTTSSNANGSSAATKTGLSGGAIAGIVVGSLAAAGAVGFFIWKKQKDQHREAEIFSDPPHDVEAQGGDYAAM